MKTTPQHLRQRQRLLCLLAVFIFALASIFPAAASSQLPAIKALYTQIIGNVCTLSWAPIPGDSITYTIEVHVFEDTWEQVATTEATTAQTTGLLEGYLYMYRIHARDANGNTSPFTTSKVTWMITVPRFISVASAGWPDQHHVYLRWGSSNGIRYQIYRKHQNQDDFDFITRVQAYEYRDYDIVFGNTYTYYLLAEGDQNNYANPSEETSIQILLKPEILSLKTTANTASLVWKALPLAAKYSVFRSVDSGSFTLAGSTTSTAFHNTGLEPGKAYSYKVQAHNAQGGLSEFSEPMTTSVMDVPVIYALKEYDAAGTPAVKLSLIYQNQPYSTQVYRSENNGAFTYLKGTYETFVTDSTVKLGSTYAYKAQFRKADGSTSAFCEPQHITILGLPAAPVFTSLKSLGTTVNIAWEAVPGATWYTVVRIKPNGEELIRYTTEGTAIIVTDNPYDELLTYYIYYTNINGSSSPNSPQKSIQLLQAPQLTRLSAYGPPSMPAVKLSWNAAAHAANYQVYRSVNGGPYLYLKGTTGLFINDNSVQLGQTYYYKVQSRSADGAALSFLSALRGIKVTGVLAAPVISSLTSASNSAYLKWEAVPGAQSYMIYRSVNGGAFQFLKGTTGLSIADAGLTYGALYSYRVQAREAGGLVSPMSASRSIRIPAQLAAPVITSLTNNGTTTATLTWGEVNGAVSYYVYRSVNGGAYSFLKGTTATFIKDAALSMGSSYAYCVQANGAGGLKSALSAARSITIK